MIVHVDGKEQGSVIVGMSRDFFGSQIIVAPDDDVSSVDGSYEFLA